MVYVNCTLTRVANLCHETLSLSVLAWRGLVHTFSGTAAHQSNGVAERRIGQLTTGIRTCSLRSCLPDHLWVEAAMHVAHAQNLLPTQTLLNRESSTKSRERQYTDLEERHALHLTFDNASRTCCTMVMSQMTCFVSLYS